LPQLSIDDAQNTYSNTYRDQYNCGQNDVNEIRENDLYKTDMYWSLYLITPPRQLLNQFTIPYVPPVSGAITMYGTAVKIKDFEDFIAKQKEGLQGPACSFESTALSKYLRVAFPGIKLIDVQNNNVALYQALRDGICDVIINTYVYAEDFISERYDLGECIVNGMPIGIIGKSLPYGLSQFGVGIGRHILRNVTDTISFWMNILMTCAPGDVDGECPAEKGGSFAQMFSKYEVHDPSVCGYDNNPPEPMNIDNRFTKQELGKILGITSGCFVVFFIILYFVLRKLCRNNEIQAPNTQLQDSRKETSIPTNIGSAQQFEGSAQHFKGSSQNYDASIDTY